RTDQTCPPLCCRLPVGPEYRLTILAQFCNAPVDITKRSMPRRSLSYARDIVKPQPRETPHMTHVDPTVAEPTVQLRHMLREHTEIKLDVVRHNHRRIVTELLIEPYRQ